MLAIRGFQGRVLTGLASIAFVLTTGMSLSSPALAASNLPLSLGLLSPEPSATATLKGLAGSNGTGWRPAEDTLTLGGLKVDTSLDGVTISAPDGPQPCPACHRPIRSGAGRHAPAKQEVVQAAETDNRSTAQADAASHLVATNKLVAYTKAVIHVVTKKPTKVHLRFGQNGNLSAATLPSEYGTAHDIALDAGRLVPGRTYSYMVVSVAKDGTQSTGPMQTFTTKGFTVYLTVFDKNHEPLQGKTVTLHSTPMSATTDDNGVVKFDNVAPGSHHLEYDADGKIHSQTVTVGNNVTVKNGKQIADAQHVAVVYDFAQPVSREQAVWSLIAVGAVVVGGGVYWLWRYRRARRRANKVAALRAKLPVYAAEPQDTVQKDT
ncbi:MAG TPA: carboxypeptidase-like regulatory domain-containing protein [Candidatus Saccharimonadales bacterium]|nr:carboxypeptidase-like regulatory domain-containing protein [Candidatus Saccharimonadales bacterium]